MSHQEKSRKKISIHALLAESDWYWSGVPVVGCPISIHALLAESDRLWIMLYSCPGNFYPRSPCGERQAKAKANEDRYKFLSTLSLRRATKVPILSIK